MRDDLPHLPFPALIGDIGGTNARFALIGHATAEMRRFPDQHTAAHQTIDDAIAAALSGAAERPRSAALALAGPITGDAVPLTNCDWIVEPKRLIHRFGLESVVLLNDFEALSLSLAGLGPQDLDRLGGGEAEPDRARVVVGPGTGLGAGALIHARGMWIPVPGEGGHIDLGPVTKRDMEIWPHIELPGTAGVSGETLLSGPGLVRLYRAIASTEGVAPGFSTPADVTHAGLAKTDPIATEAVDLFVTYLGRLAGNLALIFVAAGGVYLAGGISTKIAAALKSGLFREAFVDKYPHRPLLERMATALIVKDDAALAGISDFVRAPGRFGVELGGRFWRA